MIGIVYIRVPTYFVPMSICVGMTMIAVCWWNDSFLVKEEEEEGC